MAKLASGIIENTLNKVKSKVEIIAWLGPSISEKSYEVGKQVFDVFTKYDPEVNADLKSYN